MSSFTVFSSDNPDHVLTMDKSEVFHYLNSALIEFPFLEGYVRDVANWIDNSTLDGLCVPFGNDGKCEIWTRVTE